MIKSKMKKKKRKSKRKMRLIQMKCLNFKKMSKRDITINTSTALIVHMIMITTMKPISMSSQRVMIMRRKIDSKYKLKGIN